MNKLLSLVVVAATMSFGTAVEIGVDLTVPANGWDHKNASLVSIDLESYLESYMDDGYSLDKVVLQFTGVQNLREPEINDALNISLLKAGVASRSATQQQKFSIFPDGVDNDNTQNAGNYFQKVSNSAYYTWIEGESNVAGYTDNNDNFGAQNGSYLISARCHANTNDYTDNNGNSYYYSNSYINDGHYYSTDWRNQYHYANGGSGWGYGLWYSLQNYKTEDFERELSVATVEKYMAASNGWIGIGLDADCHYTGNVKLVATLTKADVPEPASLSLMLLGLTSLTGAYFIRKRK